LALYVIGDLHLSLGSSKPMDVFGGVWENYTEKIRTAFSELNEDDVIVLAGDTSWGMSLQEAEMDFKFLDSLPGKKLLIKGNHDYWWTTNAKMQAFFAEKDIRKLSILHNNCSLYGDAVLCGTKGYSFEDEQSHSHDLKVYKREVIRMRASLESANKAGNGEKFMFLHYPPIFRQYECHEMIEAMAEYGVVKCFYGHIHGRNHAYAFEEERSGIEFKLISADYINFTPYKILP